MTADVTLRGTRGRRRLLWALVGIATAIAGALLLSPTTPSGASSSKPTRPAIFDEPRELPKEWRWERKPYTFDHMFMRRDWRERSRRQGLR